MILMCSSVFAQQTDAEIIGLLDDEGFDFTELKSDQLTPKVLNEVEDLKELDAEQLSKATGLKSATFNIRGVTMENDEFILPSGTKIHKDQLKGKEVIFFEGGVRIGDDKSGVDILSSEDVGNIEFTETGLKVGNVDITNYQGGKVSVKSADEVSISGISTLNAMGMTMTATPENGQVEYNLINRDGAIGVQLVKGSLMEVDNGNMKAYVEDTTGKYWVDGNKHGVDGAGTLSYQLANEKKSISSNHNLFMSLDKAGNVERVSAGFDAKDGPQVYASYRVTENVGDEEQEKIQVSTSGGNGMTVCSSKCDNAIGATIILDGNKIDVDQSTFASKYHDVNVNVNNRGFKINQNDYGEVVSYSPSTVSVADWELNIGKDRIDVGSDGIVKASNNVNTVTTAKVSGMEADSGKAHVKIANSKTDIKKEFVKDTSKPVVVSSNKEGLIKVGGSRVNDYNKAKEAGVLNAAEYNKKTIVSESDKLRPALEDAGLKLEVNPSNDVSSVRDGNLIDGSETNKIGIVTHITAGTNSLGWLTQDSKTKGTYASSHFLIDQDGTVHMMVNPASPYIKSHAAGRSAIETDGVVYTSINPNTINIEIEATSADGLTDAQIYAASKLRQTLQTQYNLPQQNVWDHAEVGVSYNDWGKYKSALATAKTAQEVKSAYEQYAAPTTHKPHDTPMQNNPGILQNYESKEDYFSSQRRGLAIMHTPGINDS